MVFDVFAFTHDFEPCAHDRMKPGVLEELAGEAS
jgi:hypothetical protein